MKEIDVLKLKSMKENNEKFILLDVRENNEIDFANISPHKNRKIILMCHSVVRSANVSQYLDPLGYNVYNLIGGIDAWSKLIDPSVPIY